MDDIHLANADGLRRLPRQRRFAAMPTGSLPQRDTVAIVVPAVQGTQHARRVDPDDVEPLES